MTYEVYNITDRYNKVVYVGVTKSSKGYLTRFWEHCYEAMNSERKTLLHRAMYEEGVNNFQPHLMFEGISEADISSYEIHWIDKYNTFYKNGQGYNMTYGGHGVIGYEFTPEVRNKMSVSASEMWSKYRSDLPKLRSRNFKISTALKGRKKTIEHKKKLSLSRLGRFLREDNPFYGKHHTADTKKRLSEIKGLPVVMRDKDTHESIKEFYSAKEAARYLVDIGVTKNKTANGLILDACYGKCKTAYGYEWIFK